MSDDDTAARGARVLPDGTLTFVLTDIESSTRLWDDEPDAMGAAQRRHDELISIAVEAAGGVLVKSKGEGDSTFSVFVDPVKAVFAAEAIRDAIANESWATSIPIRVRIGVLTGVAELRDGDYFGAAVNRAARVRSLASGGEIILAASTYALVADSLLRDRVVDDRGEHELRGLQRPERVYALLPGDAKPRAFALTSRRGRVLLGVGVLIVVGIGAFVLLRSRGDGGAGAAAGTTTTSTPPPSVDITSIQVQKPTPELIRYEVTGSAKRVDTPPYQIRVLARDPTSVDTWLWSAPIMADRAGHWTGVLEVPSTLNNLRVAAVVLLPPPGSDRYPRPKLPLTGPSTILENSLTDKGPAAPGVVAVSTGS